MTVTGLVCHSGFFVNFHSIFPGYPSFGLNVSNGVPSVLGLLRGLPVCSFLQDVLLNGLIFAVCPLLPLRFFPCTF